jgi:mono/diheme cytochrome c family protein
LVCAGLFVLGCSGSSGDAASNDSGALAEDSGGPGEESTEGDAAEPDAPGAGDGDGGAGGADVSEVDASPSGDVADGGATSCVPAADTPTWNDTVGEIVWRRCGVCHGDTPLGGAPFSLLAPSDFAKSWPPGAESTVLSRVANAVASGEMPPPSQPAMPEAERAALLAWAEGCAPEGTGTFEPPDPGLVQVPVPPPPLGATVLDFRAGDYLVPKLADTYRCFPYDIDVDGDPTTSTGEVAHIVRFDFEVDEAQVVHHIVLYADPDKQFGEVPKGCEGMPADTLFMYAWAPGGQPLQFPPGYGHPVRDGDRVLLQVHYNNQAQLADVLDDSGVRIYITPPQPNEVGMVVTGPVAFSVPGLQEVTVRSQCRVDKDVTFFASMPHMHEIGKSLVVEREAASGAIQTLVEVKNWSFDDQPFYLSTMAVKAGERLITSCTFQNTNPSTVFSGSGTKDEMCFNFAYHWPPLGQAFCDEPLDEENTFQYAPGACGLDPAPAANALPSANGKVKLSAVLGFVPSAVPPDGRYDLREFNMVLNQPETIVGTVDVDKTSFEAKGYWALSDGRLTLDFDALGELVTESGAAIPYAISVSESGPWTLGQDGRLEIPNPDCEDSDMPFRWLRIGQNEGGVQVALVGIYYALLDVTLVFELRAEAFVP